MTDIFPAMKVIPWCSSSAASVGDNVQQSTAGRPWQGSCRRAPISGRLRCLPAASHGAGAKSATNSQDAVDLQYIKWSVMFYVPNFQNLKQHCRLAFFHHLVITMILVEDFNKNKQFSRKSNIWMVVTFNLSVISRAKFVGATVPNRRRLWAIVMFFKAEHHSTRRLPRAQCPKNHNCKKCV